MRKQDHLVSLISSLTQGERKFFVQQSRSGQEGKSYLKLYELLCRHNNYNPDTLCKALNKSKTALANEKKYLEKNLLTSLRQYYEGNTHVSILNRIADGVLLMERNQPEMANVAIKGAIRSATVSQQYALAFHSHGLMLTLSSDPFVSFNETEAAGQYHLEKMKEMAEQIRLTVDFEMLNAEAFAAYTKRKKDITESHRKETQRLLRNRLLKKDYPNFDLMCYKYNLLALLNARIGDTASSVEANRKCLEIYEQQPVIDVLGYWNAVANLTQSIITHSSGKMYKEWMAKLDSRYYRHLPVDAAQIDKLLQTHKSIFTAGAYLGLLHNNEIAAETVRLFTKRFIKKFVQEKAMITASHFATTALKVATCSFLIGDVEDCIDILNRLFNAPGENLAPAAGKSARLLFIMAHLEWNNFQLIPGLVPGTINYLKKADEYGGAEEMILKQFAQLVKPLKKSELREWFATFKQMIEKLAAATKAQTGINLFPFQKWIERNYKA